MKEKRKNKKNMLWMTALSILVVVMLVSSTTAVPLANKEAVENTIDKQQMKELQPKSFIEDLKEIINLLKNIKIWDILRGRLIKNMNCFNSGDLTIDKCWEYYYNGSVQSAIAESKTIIENKVSEYEPEVQHALNHLYFIDDTFSLYRIMDRIYTLKPTSVLYDIQDLMGVSDNYQDFDDFNNWTVYWTIWILSHYNQNNYNSEDWLNTSEMFYPFIDLVCSMIVAVTIIWAIPLAILFGTKGIEIACCISAVFFAPIISAMCCWIGTVEMLKNDPEYLKEMIPIVIEKGVIGVVPYILRSLFNDGWYKVGLEYILGKLHVTGIYLYPDGVDIDTGETSPQVLSKGLSGDYYTGECGFKFNVIDYDVACINVPYYVEDYRDYIQIGFDWNGDGNVDEWSPLYKQVNNVGEATYLEIWHTFPKGTKTYVYAYVRDTWGNTVTNDYYGHRLSWYISIMKNKSTDIPLLLDQSSMMKTISMMNK